MEQVEDDSTDTADLSPISLGMPVLKELGAKWLVEMYGYICSNPQFTVKGFLKSGIPDAIDGMTSVDNGEDSAEEEWTHEDNDSAEESEEIESEGDEESEETESEGDDLDH